jgi:hydrogenase maturation protein HypF
MWQALLGDLILKTPGGVIAARFHRGLARAIVAMVRRLHRRTVPPDTAPPFTAVALSGGVFQNAALLELVARKLAAEGFQVLLHGRVPANDAGLALGQALIDAARQPA